MSKLLNFKRFKNPMTRTLALNNDHEMITILWFGFLAGCDNLKLTGRENTRLRAGVIAAFEKVSKEINDGEKREILEGQDTLTFTQAEYELVDKAFDKFEYKTAFAAKVVKVLDWLSAADKVGA